MFVRLVLLAAVALSAGCKKDNPAYCENNEDCPSGECDPQSHRCVVIELDAGVPDAQVFCDTDEQCDGYCDDSGMCADCANAMDCAARTDGRNQCEAGDCVECVTSDDCDLSLPICDANMCRACNADVECEELTGPPGEAGICSEGACVGENGVIFVEAAADCAAGNGSPMTPFCEIQDAIDLVDAGDSRGAIIVRSGDYAPILIQALQLLIKGRGTARITGGSTSTPRIEIDGNDADVTMINFAVDGASASSTPAVYCAGGATCAFERFDVALNWRGLVAENATLMRVTRSKVHENQGGGILTFNSDYVIENNLIYLNGRPDGTVGGASLGQPLGTLHDFRFNTVWKNTVTTGVTAIGGVACPASASLSSNIFWDNAANEVGPSCTVDHSVIDDAVAGMMPTNTAEDPMFVSEDTFAPDLHIQPGSSAIEAGEPAAAPVIDHFGQPREGSPDSGADEFGKP